MKIKIFIWYIITTMILAYFLYHPVKKFILAGRIGKAEKKLGRSMSDIELVQMERGTKAAALLISILFSIFFNQFLIGRLLVGNN